MSCPNLGFRRLFSSSARSRHRAARTAPGQGPARTRKVVAVAMARAPTQRHPSNCSGRCFAAAVLAKPVLVGRPHHRQRGRARHVLPSSHPSFRALSVVRRLTRVAGHLLVSYGVGLSLRSARTVLYRKIQYSLPYSRPHLLSCLLQYHTRQKWSTESRGHCNSTWTEKR